MANGYAKGSTRGKVEMPKFEVTETSITVGPSVELAEYKWLKASVTVTFKGDFAHGLREAEYRYWQAVIVELKIRADIEKKYASGEMKALRKHAELRIDKLESRLRKDK